MQKMDYIVKRRKIAKNRIVFSCRPAQHAELPCSKFDSELIPHSAYVMFFCDIRVCNILQQIKTYFDLGNCERGRKWRENEEM